MKVEVEAYENFDGELGYDAWVKDEEVLRAVIRAISASSELKSRFRKALGCENGWPGHFE